jgi:hypothetical protein
MPAGLGRRGWAGGAGPAGLGRRGWADRPCALSQSPPPL